MEYSVHVPLALVIDEFQEFDIIDPSIFGDIQGYGTAITKEAGSHEIAGVSIEDM